MRDTRFMWRPLAAVLVVSVLIIMYVKFPTHKQKLADRPECPEGGLWSRRVFAPDSAVARFGPIPHGELALSQSMTDIVEFHDCQEFVIPVQNGNGHRYSSLFAIFARRFLDSSYTQPIRVQTPYDSLTMGTPMATILSYDDTYLPLGIQPNFNCLYFFRSGTGNDLTYEARMVSVGLLQESCTVPLTRQDTRGTTLTVRVLSPSDPGGGDPPPVARWDWDPANQQQYIGILCGKAWCEVHPPQDSGYTFSSSVPLKAITSMAKGWYDEQLLAVAHPKKGVSDEVSSIVGTFIPMKGLGKEVGKPENSTFSNNWIVTAHAAIRGDPRYYASKLNLTDSHDTVTNNEVSLCFVPVGATNKCLPPGTLIPECTQIDGWFGRIVHVTDLKESTMYFCVTRRSHDEHDPSMLPAPPIPGTVRWRWAVDDETMWVRCLNGCCEVKAR